MANFRNVKRLRKQLLKIWEQSLENTPEGKIPSWTADEERCCRTGVKLLKTLIDEARSEDPPPAPTINLNLGATDPEAIRQALAKAKSKK